MLEEDVQALRASGFDDARVHGAIQVVSYFNYINRVADAIHVDLEPGMEPYPAPRAPDSTARESCAPRSRKEGVARDELVTD